MTFGEKVRRLRKEKGWTQAELAKLSGLSLRTIISYEKGESYPKKQMCIRDRLRASARTVL